MPGDESRQDPGSPSGSSSISPDGSGAVPPGRGPGDTDRAYATRRPFLLRARDRTITLGDRTAVAGILNCTPDSFADGGHLPDAHSAAVRCEEIVAQGADWIDIGGESTRPGAEPVDAEEEWRRVLPALRAARRLAPALAVSIDTTKAEVARRALDEGAVIVNDVSALRFDPEMAGICAHAGTALILMHLRGEPRTMQLTPSYQNAATEVRGELLAAAAAARAAGIAPDRLLLDPGIGFGKTAEHNFEILRALPALCAAGYPVLVGASRKSLIGRVLDSPVEDRLEGSLAIAVAAVLAGAHAVRVHDVRATVRAVRIADAILRGSP
jgi:dihydropteroate synthase